MTLVYLYTLRPRRPLRKARRTVAERQLRLQEMDVIQRLAYPSIDEQSRAADRMHRSHNIDVIVDPERMEWGFADREGRQLAAPGAVRQNLISP